MSAAADKLTKVDSATEDKIAADKKAVHRRTSSAVSGVYKIEDLGKRSSFRLLRTIRTTQTPSPGAIRTGQYELTDEQRRRMSNFKYRRKHRNSTGKAFLPFRCQ